MSPYTYCANNPIRLINPNGMEIDEASKDEFNKRKSELAKAKDRQVAKAYRIAARAEKRGWTEGGKERFAKAMERASSLSGTLANLNGLEQSQTVYSLNIVQGNEVFFIL